MQQQQQMQANARQVSFPAFENMIPASCMDISLSLT